MYCSVRKHQDFKKLCEYKKVLTWTCFKCNKSINFWPLSQAILRNH